MMAEREVVRVSRKWWIFMTILDVGWLDGWIVDCGFFFVFFLVV